jgi:hypothetical protein
MAPASGVIKSSASASPIIIKIANRRKYHTGAADRFNPAKHNLKMSALIFQACRPDKGAVNTDDHLVGGFFDDRLGGNFCFIRLK